MTDCPCALDWAVVSWCLCRASRSVCPEDHFSASQWGPLNRRTKHHPSSRETLLHATVLLCAVGSGQAQRLHSLESGRDEMRWRVGRATGGEGHRCSRCWTGSRPSPGGSTSQGAGWWVIAQQQRAFEAAGEAGVLRVTRRCCRSWRVEWAAEEEEKEEVVVVEREEEVVVVEMMQ